MKWKVIFISFLVLSFFTAAFLFISNPQRNLAYEVFQRSDGKGFLSQALRNETVRERGETFEIRTRDNSSHVAIVNKTRPEVELSWFNESFTIRYELERNATQRGNRIEYNDTDKEVHIYPLEEAEGMEEGGLEIEILLREIPSTNTFNFTIEEAESYDFFYQANLTQEERDSNASRPDNVIGSYAVYHKTRRDNEYRTGKAFHIYRPKIYDADNDTTWGTMNYSNGVLSVIVPQRFLNEATYPVIVDPTFGYTSIGASTVGLGGGNDLAVVAGTSSGSGDVDSVFFYGGATSGTRSAKGAVFSLDGTNPEVGTLLTNGVSDINSGITTTTGWWEMTYSTKPSVSSGDYWVGVYTTFGTIFYYDTGSSGDGGYELFGAGGDYDDPEDFNDEITVDNRLMSIYAETAEGGGENFCDHYSGSGNYSLPCNCTLNESQDIQGNLVIISGQGRFYGGRNITNFSSPIKSEGESSSQRCVVVY